MFRDQQGTALAEMVDVSIGGARVALHGPTPAVRITFQLGPSEFFTASGVAVRHCDYELGLRFDRPLDQRVLTTALVA